MAAHTASEAWLAALVLAALGTASALAGCGTTRPRPWDRPDGGAEATEAPPTPIGSATTGATAAPDAGPPGSQTADPDVPTPPARVGGPWVRCYGGFRPSGDPKKDVTRLSLLCGPENGMRRHSKKHDSQLATLEGSVAAGTATLHDTFEARRGDCFRIFAVAEPSVPDLDVVVRSSRGTPIAADHGEDAWPIVQPDRPFCALEDDTYSWEVSAKRGAGRAAAEVWVLRARPAKP